MGKKELARGRRSQEGSVREGDGLSPASMVNVSSRCALGLLASQRALTVNCLRVRSFSARPRLNSASVGGKLVMSHCRSVLDGACEQLKNDECDQVAASTPFDSVNLHSPPRRLEGPRFCHPTPRAQQKSA